MLIVLTGIVTRKVILHLDDVVQAVFIPLVIKLKLFLELNFKEKKILEGYLTPKISLKTLTRNTHCRHSSQVKTRMVDTLCRLKHEAVFMQMVITILETLANLGKKMSNNLEIEKQKVEGNPVFRGT